MSIVSDIEARDYLGVSDTDASLPVLRTAVERAVAKYVGWDLERTSYTRYYPKTERGGSDVYFPGTWGGQPSQGGRSRLIQLDHKYVLASGLAVYEYVGAYAGQAADFSDALTLGSQYVLDLQTDDYSLTGHIVRLGAEWPKPRGSVKVTYTAGFSATELSGQMDGSTDYLNAGDIKYAVLLAIQKAYNQAVIHRKVSTTGAAGVITSEKVPDYGYTVDAGSAVALHGMARDLPVESQKILHRYRRYSIAL